MTKKMEAMTTTEEPGRNATSGHFFRLGPKAVPGYLDGPILKDGFTPNPVSSAHPRQTTFKFLVENRHQFITDYDLSEAEDIRRQFKEFHRQHKSLTTPGHNDCAEAEAAYRTEPTQENLDRLVQVRTNLATKTAHNYRAHRLVEDQQEQLERKLLAPWVIRILSRAIPLVKQRLDEVHTEEAERVMEATGAPMLHSDVVYDLWLQLRHLETLLSQAQRGHPVPIKRLLRTFGF